MKTIDKELDKVKFLAFGKVKERTKFSITKELDLLQREKQEILQSKQVDHEFEINLFDKKIASALLTNQREGFEEEFFYCHQINHSLKLKNLHL